ncbi:MAG: hypothetical protein ACKO4Z_09670 [Planctomycetota bacterium]
MAAVELKTGPTTVVVCGASNVSRGLARLAAVVGGRSSGPVDLFVTAGHGRSYGANSRVAARRLPSILGSGLWRAIDRQDRGSAGRAGPVALVTDVGNDLLYGFTVSQVAGWVRESVRRLTDTGAAIVITGLPLASIARVGPARYRALRACYVPGCRLPLGDLKASATDLDACLTGLAAERGIAMIRQPGEWYGFDAIHIRRRRLDELWHATCDAWGLAGTPAVRRATWRDWAQLGSKAAEVRSLARRMRYTPQPVVTRPDLRLWLY